MKKNKQNKKPKVLKVKTVSETEFLNLLDELLSPSVLDELLSSPINESNDFIKNQLNEKPKNKKEMLVDSPIKMTETKDTHKKVIGFKASTLAKPLKDKDVEEILEYIYEEILDANNFNKVTSLIINLNIVFPTFNQYSLNDKKVCIEKISCHLRNNDFTVSFNYNDNSSLKISW